MESRGEEDKESDRVIGDDSASAVKVDFKVKADNSIAAADKENSPD